MKAILPFILSVTATAALASSVDYVVVVHPDNPATSITRQQLSSLFLKKTVHWPGLGVEVSPVDLDDGSVVREAFSRDVHGRSVSSIKNFWQRQIFSGREVPPPEASGDAQAVSYVRDHPGGIGYVSPSARLDGVKAITVSD